VDPLRPTLDESRQYRLRSDLPAPSASHSIHLHENQFAFLNSLTGFVAETLRARDSLILVLTDEHRRVLDERLEKLGIDVRPATGENRYICLDSEEVLAQSMVEGWPDKSRVFKGAESLLLRAQSGARRGSGAVVVCGEVAPLLVARGKHEAAIELEKLWSELMQRHSFTLRCDYQISCFADESHREIFLRVCALHDHVVPSERYTPLTSNEDGLDREIAHRKQIEKRLWQAEKLAAAGRLAATIAHEINNPLEAVTNLIYLAKSAEGVPDEVCRQLEIADRELARVAQLAQQTLGFYRDNSCSKWISVTELINDVLFIYERKLTYKRIGPRVSADANLRMYGKQGEMKQALSNLMANAIDASKIGGELWLCARKATNWSKEMEPGVRITVADNGSGMSAEVQRQMFVPFFTTKPGIGTGIGLWVTKRLIEQQGGFLHFRSKQGQDHGTVMSFFVPDAPSPALEN
jgi:signal transduction histidine kinase